LSRDHVQCVADMIEACERIVSYAADVSREDLTSDRKTLDAISIPEDVFERVERAAKRLDVSRSELMTRAASAFLDERRAAEVTASYDEAVAPEPGEEGETEAETRFRREAARRALLKVQW